MVLIVWHVDTLSIQSKRGKNAIEREASLFPAADKTQLLLLLLFAKVAVKQFLRDNVLFPFHLIPSWWRASFRAVKEDAMRS